MTQHVKQTLWACDRHGLDTVYVLSRAVDEKCNQCNKNMSNAGYVETKEEEN